jgi:Sortilin, neurotensin receptor 3,
MPAALRPRTTNASVRFCVRLAIIIVASFTSAPTFAQTPTPINPEYFADLKWRSIGPPRSGYVSAPAGIPGDPTTYYAGMPEGGVWKTTNAGNTWKPVFDEMHVASVGAVAVAPSEPNTVYVGTGDRSGWSFTPGKGVFKSTDAGKTWTNVGLRSSPYIGAVIIAPRNPNVVLVAAQGRGGRGGGAASATQAGDERGVYRTADGGRTWTRVLPTTGPADASDI